MSHQVLLSRLAIIIRALFQHADYLIVELTLCWVCSRGAWLTTSTRRILALHCRPMNGWVHLSSGSGPSSSGKEKRESVEHAAFDIHVDLIEMVVRARLRKLYIRWADEINPHTYLDGACSFTYLGVRAVGTFHSTATLSIQRVTAACMGFGSCTVSIFPCPAMATLAGQAILFLFLHCPNPNPIHV